MSEQIERTTILFVDDDPDIQPTYRILFRKEYRVLIASGGRQALSLLEGEPEVSVAIVDQKMPEMTGVELLGVIREKYPDITRVLLTGYADLDAAIQAINTGGVYRYLRKPWESNDELRSEVRQAIEYYQLRRRTRQLEEQFHEIKDPPALPPPVIKDESSVPGIVGISTRLRAAVEKAIRAAPSDAPVIIQGETGTGKEAIARVIHERSSRDQERWEAFNCAALPETLSEAELFGHEAGAFTGAAKARPGKFELAHKGTLFFDEISELRPEAQAMLLRALQEGEIYRLGASRPTPVDVRIVAATNRDLQSMVEKNLFRKDLYHRLNVIEIHLPLLRERREDIPLLLENFRREFAKEQKKRVLGFTPAALDRLTCFDWPGNIRQLKNCVRHAVIFTRDEMIGTNDLPEYLWFSEEKVHLVAPRTLKELNHAKRSQFQEFCDQLESRFLSRILSEAEGNVLMAAERAGMLPSRLRQMMSLRSIRAADFRIEEGK